ncbi:hypothetical protein PTSG_10177 [Salpingoeca rosetta]|uniref:Uncharacterized protein n=1 Tax=Salpingoeca rosetta (strain ATCC 50818 / BSB-021) TaxID=946362 RepID=F2UQI8_SALR5|nr:uncharacterized protein PTSG_10177 [Salpingoeca rosetta]EGD79893.1 hypothetical protein PTSG_10177 [Salpingoeca rosetta]|eukprot:XP_004988514.1 hypothetical protein PTSG_10177 [Salpingoeca rosetta]
MSFFQLSRDGFVGVDRSSLPGGDGSSRPNSRVDADNNTFTFSNVNDGGDNNGGDANSKGDDGRKSDSAGNGRAGSGHSQRHARSRGQPGSTMSSRPQTGANKHSLQVTIESKKFGHHVKQRANRRFDDALDEEHEVTQQKLDMLRTTWRAKQDTYKVHAYGTPEQKKQYQENLRQEILTQLQEKEQKERKEKRERSKEAQVAIAQDHAVVQSEHDQHRERALKMKQYSRFNQQLMDTRKREAMSARQQQHQHERTLLDQESFNWSKTLT